MLLAKLAGSYLVPTLALVLLAPLVGYHVARQGFEEEVGQRLVTSAASAAASLRADVLLTLQPGDEGNRTHRNLHARLEALRAASRVERLYAFDRSRRLLVGAPDPAPIGSPLPELERDRLELERVFAGTAAPSTLTFEGADRRLYRTGYAPVLDDSGRVVAAVAADASADFFTVLRRFGLSMAALAFGLGALGLVLFLAAGQRWILQPVRRLLDAVGRIGRGDLASPVTRAVDDELGALADGLEVMRARLQARERELQLMLAGIAHEVRNPLGGMTLFAGLLAEELQGEPQKLEHVKTLQRELGHLERLVEDFLGYAREPRLNLEPVEARALLEDLAELLRADAEAKGVRLEIEAEALSLNADPSALRRALLNLARNAIQASPAGGRVRLAAAAREDRAVLSVADEGPGVPVEARDRLFTPFHTTKEQGLGLGLALVRRIAEAHGGTARYVEGAGAIFALELPRA